MAGIASTGELASAWELASAVHLPIITPAPSALEQRPAPFPVLRFSAAPTPPPPPIPEIRCGQSVSANIAGNNDFQPFMLDLRAATGNTRLQLSTCSSPVQDPDLCLFREYIDDDQSEPLRLINRNIMHARPGWHERFKLRFDLLLVLAWYPHESRCHTLSPDAPFACTIPLPTFTSAHPLPRPPSPPAFHVLFVPPHASSRHFAGHR